MKSEHRCAVTLFAIACVMMLLMSIVTCGTHEGMCMMIANQSNMTNCIEAVQRCDDGN